MRSNRNAGLAPLFGAGFTPTHPPSIARARARRAPPRRRWSARRAIRGALTLALYGALAAGLGMAATGAWGYYKGRAAGVAARDAHWTGVINGMVSEYARMADEEAEKARATEARWRGAAQESYDELASTRAELARARGDLSAAIRRHDELRLALDAAATGGRPSADDSVDAARERAAALGGALAEALQAHEECRLEAEDGAADARVLLTWGRGIIAGQRAPSEVKPTP